MYNSNLFRISFVAVITWHPIAFAWNIFNNSRGLAQINSAFGFSARVAKLWIMIASGLRPVSAILPANVTGANATSSAAGVAIHAYGVEIK